MALAFELDRPTQAPDVSAALVPVSDLYLPHDGMLAIDHVREREGYQLHVGCYITELASHPTGVYVPDGFVPGESPVVGMAIPWLTGNRGHNHGVAEEFALQGAGVIVKGTPRYAGPDNALTFTEDANEMYGLVREVERQRLLGELGVIRLYGESQAAGKLYSALALAGRYDRDIPDALGVAPCPPKPIRLRDAPELMPQLLEEGLTALRLARKLGLSGVSRLAGTLSRKDAHHHAMVIRVLLSGEQGQIIPHINPGQNWSVTFGERDRQSRPQHAVAELEAALPGVKTRILPDLGHVATIKSQEVREQRAALVRAA